MSATTALPAAARRREVRLPARGRGAVDPSTLVIERIMLASEGREYSREAIDQVVALAAAENAGVHVLSIARVHGTAFGMPNPGLLPTREEWDAQKEYVARAVKALKKRGVKAGGAVIGTRKAASKICDEAYGRRMDVIVMGGDPPRQRLVADFIWAQEPYRVQRKARIPVFIVTE
jgi:nucleotide-binding universal stress UspA family protein